MTRSVWLRTFVVANVAGLIGIGVASADGGWELVLEFGNTPQDIAVDSGHNVYILDVGLNRVQVFAPDGQFLREMPGFQNPRALCIDENDVVYVLEACRVYRYTTDFQPLGSWDSCIGQGDLQQGFSIDVSAGLVYIGTANALLKFLTDGTFLRIFDGWGWEGVQVVPDGSAWVVNSDTAGGLVRQYSPDGEVLAEWFSILPGEESSGPTGVAVDSQGRIFVPDINNVGKVKIFRPNGILDDLVQVEMRLVVSCELDGDDVLYVGTAFPDRVMRFRYKLVPVEPTTWGSVKGRF